MSLFIGLSITAFVLGLTFLLNKKAIDDRR
jgi:hypothetical protein